MDGWEAYIWGKVFGEGWKLVRFVSSREVGWELNCEGL